jgi:4-hydroxybutyrate CoA-transferase
VDIGGVYVRHAAFKEKSKRSFKTWQEEYRAKLTSAEEAAKIVQSGEHIFFGGGTGIPSAFAQALGKRAHELKDVMISEGFAMGLFDYMKPENKESFHIETMFVGPMERVCMEWGVAQYKPMHLSDIPAAATYAAHRRVAFVATPPDENGYMNRSCFGSFLPNEECVKPAETIIVEINRNAPWLNSDDFKIHVSDVDFIIENDFPMFELPRSRSPTRRKKSRNTSPTWCRTEPVSSWGLAGLPTRSAIFSTVKRISACTPRWYPLGCRAGQAA